MITNLKIGYGGRLGNQMFQYAMLMGVAAKTGWKVKIPYDNALATKADGCLDLYTGKWIPYKFVLDDCFDMNIHWIENTASIIGLRKQYKEKFFHFDENVFNQGDFTDFDGYFQSYKYFEHIMPEIRKAFTFHSAIQMSALSLMHWPMDKEVVSIHVRRGDYLGIPDILPVCESEYFEEALTHFTDKEYTFVVFSDDIPWCKEAFGDAVYYSLSNSPYVDMYTMSMCNHHIITNSTFSLWAALLNTKENKKVIAPKNWFGPKLASNDTKDLMPEGCIRI